MALGFALPALAASFTFIIYGYLRAHVDPVVVLELCLSSSSNIIDFHYNGIIQPVAQLNHVVACDVVDLG